MNQPTTKHVYISGRVQGVGYRYSLAIEAEALGVLGWCRNLPDGRVEALLQGSFDRLGQLLAWCQQGPVSADVDGVEQFDVPDAERYIGFEIRR